MKKKPVVSRFGERFGHLVVLPEPVDVRVSPGGHRFSYVTVRCDCGVVKKTYIGRLTTGKVTSCGCQGPIKTSARLRQRNTTHGQSDSRTYKIWKGMVSRCSIRTASGFKHYGGRGVKVCSRWRESYESFIADMGEAPHNLTLDRIDVNGNYEPGNCRWVSRSDQCNNRRVNVVVEVNGVTDTLTRTCTRHAIPRHRVYTLMKRDDLTHQQAIARLLREKGL